MKFAPCPPPIPPIHLFLGALFPNKKQKNAHIGMHTDKHRSEKGKNLTRRDVELLILKLACIYILTHLWMNKDIYIYQ